MDLRRPDFEVPVNTGERVMSAAEWTYLGLDSVTQPVHEITDRTLQKKRSLFAPVVGARELHDAAPEYLTFRERLKALGYNMTDAIAIHENDSDPMEQQGRLWFSYTLREDIGRKGVKNAFRVYQIEIDEDLHYQLKLEDPKGVEGFPLLAALWQTYDDSIQTSLSYCVHENKESQIAREAA